MCKFKYVLNLHSQIWEYSVHRTMVLEIIPCGWIWIFYVMYRSALSASASCSITDAPFLFHKKKKINIRFNVWFNQRSGRKKAIGNECIPCRRRIYSKYKLVQSIDVEAICVEEAFQKEVKEKTDPMNRVLTEVHHQCYSTLLNKLLTQWFIATKLATFPFSFGSIHAFYIQSNCHQHYCIPNIKRKPLHKMM